MKEPQISGFNGSPWLTRVYIFKLFFSVHNTYYVYSFVRTCVDGLLSVHSAV